MEKATWVDFKKVKDSLLIQKVVEHYGWELKPSKGNELVGLCPFHEDTKPSFRVNTEKNIFNCFGCNARGNVLRLIELQEGVDVRRAALKAIEWFGIEGATKEPPGRGKSKKGEKEKQVKEYKKE